MVDTKVNVVIEGAVMVVDVQRKVVSGYEVASRTTQLGDKAWKEYSVPVDGRVIITDVNAVSYDRDQLASYPIDIEKDIKSATEEHPLNLDMPDGTKVPPYRGGKSDVLNRDQVMSPPQSLPPAPGKPAEAGKTSPLDPTKPEPPTAVQPITKPGEPVKVGDTVKIDKPNEPAKPVPELHPKDKAPESGKVDMSGGINTQKDEPKKK